VSRGSADASSSVRTTCYTGWTKRAPSPQE
jgi:hypothetical protein